MKFNNKFLALILLCLIASSHFISTLEITRHHTHHRKLHTKRVKFSHKAKTPGEIILQKVSASLKKKLEAEKEEMNKWLEFIDVKTCQEKEDQDAPDMDRNGFTNFDLGEFFLAVISNWGLPFMSDMFKAMSDMRNLMSPTCPMNRPNFLSTYKYMLICNQDSAKIKSDSEKAKIDSASQIFFTADERKQMENLNPHQTCLKAHEIIQKHLVNLKYGDEELYDKADARVDKVIKLGQTLETLSQEKTINYMNPRIVMVAELLEKIYKEVISDKDFMKLNKIDASKDSQKIWEEVKRRVVQKYYDLINVKNQLFNSLPNCANMPNQNLNKPMKLSFIRRLSVFLKTLKVWAHKCSVLRFFAEIVSDKVLDIIVNTALQILEMFIGGTIVSIAKMIITVIRVVGLLIKAFQTWGQQKYKESSILFGTAVGVLLNGVFDFLGLSDKMARGNTSIANDSSIFGSKRKIKKF